MHSMSVLAHLQSRSPNSRVASCVHDSQTVFAVSVSLLVPPGRAWLKRCAFLLMLAPLHACVSVHSFLILSLSTRACYCVSHARSLFCAMHLSQCICICHCDVPCTCSRFMSNPVVFTFQCMSRADISGRWHSNNKHSLPGHCACVVVGGLDPDLVDSQECCNYATERTHLRALESTINPLLRILESCRQLFPLDYNRLT